MANDVGLKPPDVKSSGDLGGKHGHSVNSVFLWFFFHSVNSGPTNINKCTNIHKTLRFFCESNQMCGISYYVYNLTDEPTSSLDSYRQ